MRSEMFREIFRLGKKFYFCSLSNFATNRKRWNLLKVFIEDKFIRRLKVNYYPIMLTICPGNICNLRCPLCPTGQRSSGRKRGFMDFECFKKIMDECGPYLYSLDLYNWGEPLLNQRIFEMIKYAKTYKVKTSVSSNLNHFDDNMCYELIASGLDMLIVSLNGASQETVSKYQIGLDFRATINNIKVVIEKKKELSSSRPFVQWRFLVNKHNEKEIDQARLMSEQLEVDILEICYFRCDMGQELFLDPTAQFNNVSTWLPENEQLSMYDYDERARKKKPIVCHWLWRQSTINWNGAVTPCCAVWPEKFDFGNVNNNSFFDIWNNEKYQEARQVMLGGDIVAKSNICQICKRNGAIL